jgi:hypothetical protein
MKIDENGSINQGFDPWPYTHHCWIAVKHLSSAIRHGLIDESLYPKISFGAVPNSCNVFFSNLSEACCGAKREPSPEPVEPGLALHQGFLEPSPEPSPEPC